MFPGGRPIRINLVIFSAVYVNLSLHVDSAADPVGASGAERTWPPSNSDSIGGKPFGHVSDESRIGGDVYHEIDTQMC
jgi:hypothetical protein